MLEILFAICMFVVFGEFLILGVKAAWGIAKIFLTLIFLPLILIGMVLGGLTYIALPIVVIIGIISLITAKV